MTLKDALILTKQKRPSILPNKG